MNDIAWSPLQALGFGFRLLGRRYLPDHPDLLLRLAAVLGGGRQSGRADEDPLAVQVSDLLMDLYEHIFTAPDNERRRTYLLAHAGRRVLDFGCGAGFFALNLALHGRQVTCIETNPVKLAFLREAATELGIDDRLSFEASGAYDSIFCINVLDHLPDPPATVGAFAGLLGAGDSLYLAAHFTDDGTHVSDPRLIEQTFHMLASHFERTAVDQSLTALLDGWRRRDPGTPPDELLLVDERFLVPERFVRLVPCAIAALESARGADGRITVSAPAFYVRGASLGPVPWSILSLCDGRRTVADISESVSAAAPAAMVRAVLIELWQLHLLSMRIAPATPRT